MVMCPPKTKLRFLRSMLRLVLPVPTRKGLRRMPCHSIHEMPPQSPPWVWIAAELQLWHRTFLCFEPFVVFLCSLPLHCCTHGRTDHCLLSSSHNFSCHHWRPPCGHARARCTRGQLSGISVVLVLTMSALGGSMVPRYVMSESLQQYGLCTFNAWALDGFDKVFWRELPVEALAPQLAAASEALTTGA